MIVDAHDLICLDNSLSAEASSLGIKFAWPDEITVRGREESRLFRKSGNVMENGDLICVNYYQVDRSLSPVCELSIFND